MAKKEQFQLGLEVKYKPRTLARLAKEGLNTNKMIKDTANAWGEITRRQFLTETDPEGRRWAKLKPSTLERKQNNPKSIYKTAIGRDTGYAFYSSGYKKIKKDSFEIGFRAKYLVYFHQGKRNQEPRPIYIFQQRKKLLDKETKKLIKEFNTKWESKKDDAR